MKTCKRLLAALLTVLMAVTIMPLNVAFATTGTGTQDDPILISTMADLKAVLEGLGSDAYPVDAYYKLANDIDTLREWVFASEANQIKAAADLDMNNKLVPETYKAATQEDIDDTSVILYTKDGESYVEYTGERPTAPEGYYVVDELEHYARDPLTLEQFVTLDPDQRETLISANSVETPSITPVNKEFTGTFDGNNKTIRGLKIHVPSATEAGMFLNVGNKTIIDGETETKVPAVVKDFTIDKTSVISLVSADNALGVSAGAVAGTNEGVIQNVTSNATVSVMVKLPLLFAHVGGLIGTNGAEKDNVAVTNCTFGGRVEFIVSEASFEDTSKLSSIDATSIQIGGIAGDSVDALEGTVGACAFSVNFIGGQDEYVYEINAGDKPTGYNFTESVPNEHKVVDNKDAATYYDGWSGTITKTTPGENDKNHQLITYEGSMGKDYYIRRISCGHKDAVYKEAVPATCSTDGNEAHWYCEACDSYFVSTLDPRNNPTAETTPKSKITILANNNHVAATPHDAKAATCKDTGNVQYWTCDACGKYFLSDPVGDTDVQAVNKSATVISKNPKNHTNVTHNTAVAATCTKAGNKEYWYCSGCGKYYLEDPVANPNASNVKQSATTIAATGHKYGAWEQYDETQHKRVCENDSTHIQYKSHTFKNVVTKPTTEAQGYTTHTCTVCGYSYIDSYTDPLPSSVEPKGGSGYSKDSTGKYLITTMPAKKDGITVDQLKNSLKNDTHGYTVRDEKGNAVTSGIVKTGYTVEITGLPKTKVTICVRGDVNKDGKVSSADYVKVKNHILGKIDLSKDKAAFYAADADKSNDIKSKDYIQIKKLIMKG